jgi:hypothetical protein
VSALGCLTKQCRPNSKAERFPSGCRKVSKNYFKNLDSYPKGFRKVPEKFTRSQENMVNKLFIFFSSAFWYDSRLRCDVVDLYFKLYGRKRPQSVPIPELAMLRQSQSKAEKAKFDVSFIFFTKKIPPKKCSKKFSEKKIQIFFPKIKKQICLNSYACNRGFVCENFGGLGPLV